MNVKVKRAYLFYNTEEGRKELENIAEAISDILVNCDEIQDSIQAMVIENIAKRAITGRLSKQFEETNDYVDLVNYVTNKSLREVFTANPEIPKEAL